MTMNKMLLTAGAIVLLTAAPAFANDYRHARDHREHHRMHHWTDDFHAYAHEDGFRSRWEHRSFHHRLRHLHRDFHDDHPNTWHDHHRRRHW